VQEEGRRGRGKRERKKRGKGIDGGQSVRNI
jgi:hypothetical protein